MSVNPEPLPVSGRERACGCAGYSRAEAMRSVAAQAGLGLRAIEPGMPLPAGTGLSRRSFLARTAGLGLAVFGGSALAPRAFEEGIAAAQAAMGDGRILVSIFLTGGIDSLSLLAPVEDPLYVRKRPNLALAPSGDAMDVFTEDTRLHWHPSARPLRDLHRAGKVTVLPAVGYDDPNGSHFTSRHYWEVGALDPRATVGWLGRYLDRVGTQDNPLQGLSLDFKLAPALAAASVPVATVSQPENFLMFAREVWNNTIEAAMMQHWAAMGSPASDEPALSAARRATAMTVGLQGRLASMQGTSAPWQSAISYPSVDGFPRQLAVLADMIGRNLPLRIVALDANGAYDTHDDQVSTLPLDLDLFSRSLAAFQADLEARGLADRVLTHVWTEFGRRPEDNGTGTDHGAAGIGFVIGSRARGQMVGEFPGLTTLDRDDNLRHTSDFRALYASLLEQWLDTDASGIVPDAARFGRPVLVR